MKFAFIQLALIVTILFLCSIHVMADKEKGDKEKGEKRKERKREKPKTSESKKKKDANGKRKGKKGKVQAPMKTYSMAEITSSTSLAVINGAVIDLSSWVNRHPGGSSPIQGLIGTDGSDAFNAEHGGDSEVSQKLKQLTVGTLDANAKNATAPAKTFTMAEIEGSTSLSLINNKVYDLSSWVNQHPGGSGPIQSLIGTDGTSSFNGKHGNSSGPKSKLESFCVGTLAA